MDSGHKILFDATAAAAKPGQPGMLRHLPFSFQDFSRLLDSSICKLLPRSEEMTRVEFLRLHKIGKARQ